MGKDSEDSDNDEKDVTEEAPEEGKKRKRKRKRKRKNAQDEDTEETLKEEIEQAAPTIDDERSQQVDRTIFVEGIPFSATAPDVKAFFVGHGLTDIEECRLPVWQDSGRLRGYGHIVFQTLESKTRAIKELNGKYLKDRYLTISEAKKPREQQRSESTSPPSRTLLVANLSYQATEEDIEKVLKKYGAIVDGGVRVVRHSADERRSKGFAYVEFEDVQAATAAMKDRIVILDRPCRTDYDHGRIKGSFRAANGRFWSKEYGQGGSKRHRDS